MHIFSLYIKNIINTYDVDKLELTVADIAISNKGLIFYSCIFGIFHLEVLELSSLVRALKIIQLSNTRGKRLFDVETANWEEIILDMFSRRTNYQFSKISNTFQFHLNMLIFSEM